MNCTNQETFRFVEIVKNIPATVLNGICLQDAIQHFDDAIKINPNSEKVFCNRSMCYAALKMWDRAYEDAKRAIELCDGYVKAYYWTIRSAVRRLLTFSS
jgi:tetratricopeptide (TPR) repeat protein